MFQQKMQEEEENRFCIYRNKTFNRRKIMIIFVAVLLLMVFLMGRLVYLMIFCSEYYGVRAENLHERERDIKAARGNIYDRNGVILAENKTVCTISVIHSQIEDPEKVIAVLTKELGMSEETVRKRVEKVSSIERIKTNVEKETGDAIRAYELAGVKIDEDYKRYYPYDSLASKVLGFTGGDNQGIIGLEVKYENWLKGRNGKILTMTDAAGVELENAFEDREEPVPGHDLTISLDYNIQMYAQQMALKVKEEKGAKQVSVIIMDPQNGELLAMVNVPEFNLNDPFDLGEAGEGVSEEQKQELLNQMWRNPAINDTYEPGSTFKIITAAAGLEAGVVKLEDTFSCPGFRIVEDRKIRCHKVGGHGSETFLQGAMNSCNPVFIDVGQRLGVEQYYRYFIQFGLKGKTGVDLPGEASTIMHKKENMGPVELATVSFGQSFQITPIQLAATVSSLINGGTRITPHLGLYCEKTDGSERISVQKETEQKRILSEETSARLRSILFQVVENGGGKNGKVEGYQVGGKTGSAEVSSNKSVKTHSWFTGFVADDEHPLAVTVILEQAGGGASAAAPLAGQLLKKAIKLGY